MTKRNRTLAQILIVLAAIAVLIIGRDLYLRRQEVLDCGDGPRRRIDLRDFSTQYSAYSLELEVILDDKAKISTKLTPEQFQQLSESLQSSREFRLYAVAGYNSCAISKDQYGKFGARYQALDSLAREINALLMKPSPTQEEKNALSTLTSRYGELASKLGTQ